jgi:hypothetical protein
MLICLINKGRKNEKSKKKSSPVEMKDKKNNSKRMSIESSNKRKDGERGKSKEKTPDSEVRALQYWSFL